MISRMRNSSNPPSPIKPVQGYLLNGASKAMNVNGTVGSPVIFTQSPSVAGEVWVIKSLACFLFDNGITAQNTFGVIAALTNGLLIEVQSNGVLYTLPTIKDNVDLMHFFSNMPLVNASGTGWLNQIDYYFGRLFFETGITLKQTSGDFIRCKVQDNITAIDMLRMSVQGWAEKP